MNQILSFKSGEDEKNRMQKIVRFFAVFIMIFGLIFVGEGTYASKINMQTKKNISSPSLSIQKEENITLLKIKSTIGIKNISYCWNDGIKNKINKNGEKIAEEEIDTAIGSNNLKVEITDINGNVTKYNPVQIEYQNSNGTTNSNTENNSNNNQNTTNWKEAVASDKTKPKITLSATKGKVVIHADDETKMSYATYKWNNGEETKITGLSEDEKSLNIEIDAIKGDNKLNVKAYDKAGNVEEITKDIHGTDGPKITTARENDEIIINVKDEYNITKVVYNFNGEEKTVDNINAKTYELRLKLVDGNNYIIVDAYEGIVKNEYKGKTTK